MRIESPSMVEIRRKYIENKRQKLIQEANKFELVNTRREKQCRICNALVSREPIWRYKYSVYLDQHTCHATCWVCTVCAPDREAIQKYWVSVNSDQLDEKRYNWDHISKNWKRELDK